MADDPNTPTDEAHGFAPHYDQHVWIFRDNPMGPLEPYNTNATCAHTSTDRRRSALPGAEPLRGGLRRGCR